MLTKTKELILNKSKHPSQHSLKSQQAHQPIPAIQNLPRHRQYTHVSHINEHHFIVSSQRKEPFFDTHSNKQLQVQNLRLIEENMRLVEWSHTILNKLKVGISKAISTIEEFRYLEGVNILYNLLGQLAEYESSKLVSGSRLSFHTEEQVPRRYANPESQGSLLLQFDKLKIWSQVDFKIIPTKDVEYGLEGPFPSFVRPKAEPVRQAEKSDQPLWRMLFVQGLAIQSLKDWFPPLR